MKYSVRGKRCDSDYWRSDIDTWRSDASETAEKSYRPDWKRKAGNSERNRKSDNRSNNGTSKETLRYRGSARVVGDRLGVDCRHDSDTSSRSDHRSHFTRKFQTGNDEYASYKRGSHGVWDIKEGPNQEDAGYQYIIDPDISTNDRINFETTGGSTAVSSAFNSPCKIAAVATKKSPEKVKESPEKKETTAWSKGGTGGGSSSSSKCDADDKQKCRTRADEDDSWRDGERRWENRKWENKDTVSKGNQVDNTLIEVDELRRSVCPDTARDEVITTLLEKCKTLFPQYLKLLPKYNYEIGSLYSYKSADPLTGRSSPADEFFCSVSTVRYNHGDCTVSALESSDGEGSVQALRQGKAGEGNVKPFKEDSIPNAQEANTTLAAGKASSERADAEEREWSLHLESAYNYMHLVCEVLADLNYVMHNRMRSGREAGSEARAEARLERASSSWSSGASTGGKKRVATPQKSRKPTMEIKEVSAPPGLEPTSSKGGGSSPSSTCAQTIVTSDIAGAGCFANNSSPYALSWISCVQLFATTGVKFISAKSRADEKVSLLKYILFPKSVSRANTSRIYYNEKSPNDSEKSSSRDPMIVAAPVPRESPKLNAESMNLNKIQMVEISDAWRRDLKVLAQKIRIQALQFIGALFVIYPKSFFGRWPLVFDFPGFQVTYNYQELRVNALAAARVLPMSETRRGEDKTVCCEKSVVEKVGDSKETGGDEQVGDSISNTKEVGANTQSKPQKTFEKESKSHINQIFPYLLNNSSRQKALPKLPALLALGLFDDSVYIRQLALIAVNHLLNVDELRSFPVPLENLQDDRLWEKIQLAEPVSPMSKFTPMVDLLALNVRMLHMVCLSLMSNGRTDSVNVALKTLTIVAQFTPYGKLKTGLLSNLLLNLGPILASLGVYQGVRVSKRIHWMVSILSSILRKTAGAAVHREIQLSLKKSFVVKTKPTLSNIVDPADPLPTIAKHSFVDANGYTSVGEVLLHLTLEMISHDSSTSVTESYVALDFLAMVNHMLTSYYAEDFVDEDSSVFKLTEAICVKLLQKMKPTSPLSRAEIVKSNSLNSSSPTFEHPSDMSAHASSVVYLSHQRALKLIEDIKGFAPVSLCPYVLQFFLSEPVQELSTNDSLVTKEKEDRDFGERFGIATETEMHSNSTQCLAKLVTSKVSTWVYYRDLVYHVIETSPDSAQRFPSMISKITCGIVDFVLRQIKLENDTDPCMMAALQDDFRRLLQILLDTATRENAAVIGLGEVGNHIRSTVDENDCIADIDQLETVLIGKNGGDWGNGQDWLSIVIGKWYEVYSVSLAKSGPLHVDNVILVRSLGYWACLIRDKSALEKVQAFLLQMTYLSQIHIEAVEMLQAAKTLEAGTGVETTKTEEEKDVGKKISELMLKSQQAFGTTKFAVGTLIGEDDQIDFGIVCAEIKEKFPVGKGLNNQLKTIYKVQWNCITAVSYLHSHNQNAASDAVSEALLFIIERTNHAKVKTIATKAVETIDPNLLPIQEAKVERGTEASQATDCPVQD